MQPLPLLITFAAEPASIVYIVTGAVGLLFARLRLRPARTQDPSVAMLFCRRVTHEKMARIRLT